MRFFQLVILFFLVTLPLAAAMAKDVAIASSAVSLAAVQLIGVPTGTLPPITGG